MKAKNKKKQGGPKRGASGTGGLEFKQFSRPNISGALGDIDAVLEEVESEEEEQDLDQEQREDYGRCGCW